MWSSFVQAVGSDQLAALIAAIVAAVAGAVAGQHPLLSRLLTALSDTLRGTRTTVTVSKEKVGAVLLGLILASGCTVAADTRCDCHGPADCACAAACDCARCEASANAPAPVGQPPGKNFHWGYLPHCGWGWVQDGCERLMPAAIPHRVQVSSGCAGGVCRPAYSSGSAIPLTSAPAIQRLLNPPCAGGACQPWAFPPVRAGGCVGGRCPH